MINDKPLISIVIPVYNVEKYLDRCMESIVSQTYKNIEIILIDDKSKDSSKELIEKWAKKDKRIKTIFLEENKGQAHARNLGIENSNGEYIGFVDSDDYIDSQMYESLLNLILDNKADLSSCGIDKVGPNGHLSYFGNMDGSTIVLSKEEALERLCDNQEINNSVDCKLIKSTIIKNNPFNASIKYEDADIVYKWFNESEKIVHIYKPYYKYYMSSTSTLRGKFNPRLFDFIGVSKNKVSFYENNYPKLAKKAALNTAEELLYVLYQSRKEKQYKDRQKELIIFVKSLIKKYGTKAYTKKGTIKLRTFKCGKHCFYFVTNMIELIKKIKRGSNHE